MNFIIYGRVSSDEQVSNYSLGTQVEACRNYVYGIDGQIAGDEYFDLKENIAVPAPNENTVTAYAEDFTGTVPIEERPKGRKIFELLKNGKADALVVYRIDRLARPPEEGDEWNTPILIRGLAKIGKEIHIVNHGRIGTSFADLLLAMLDSKVAGEERRAIIERTSRGRRAKAQAGRVVGCGGRLFGYEYQDDAYIIRENEARQVRRIYELYTTPDENGKRRGTWGVVWTMERETGRKWPVVKVNRILHNPAYRGKWRYADSVVEIPAIVDDKVWREAQRLLKNNLTNSPRNVKRFYLLRGLVHCGCGCHRKCICKYFNGHRGDRQYYVPVYQDSKRYPGKCTGRSIAASKLEREAWNYVREMFHTDTFEKILERIAESEHSKANRAQKRIEEIDAELRELDAEAERLAGNMADGLVGKKMLARIGTVNARHESLETERKELLEQQPTDAPDRVTRLIELREAYIWDIESANNARRRQIVEAIGLRVTLNKTEGVITSDFGIERTFVY